MLSPAPNAPMFTYLTRLGEGLGFDFGRLGLCACQRYLDDNDHAVHRCQGDKKG